MTVAVGTACLMTFFRKFSNTAWISYYYYYYYYYYAFKRLLAQTTTCFDNRRQS